MTNYPRDEFDRVPEFNTRVGSHHANGWAQAAASDGKGGKFRWVAMAAVLVLLVGAVSYFFFGPNGQMQLLGSSPSESPSVSQNADDAQSSPSPSASPTPSSTIDDSEVLFEQLVGVYNGAEIAGIAGFAQQALLEAGFEESYSDDWVRFEEESAVYYTVESYRTTAEKVAEVLNIDEVYQTTNIPNRLTVVLGADDPLEFTESVLGNQ
ncbi:LytR C-terminal domain-containing protein [Glutamicibacter uratoxydans]|uniref:LytR C-terminal domain-containing protein n=1 Tax=Glutamicibacter uratoxydans TaxID=43667 RepID=UPI003D6EE3B4